MNLVERLSKKQGDGQIALNSVFLGHHGFRLKHIDNFYARIVLEPFIYLQLPWWINIGSTIAEYFSSDLAHIRISGSSFWNVILGCIRNDAHHTGRTRNWYYS
jgi:hypothetical protein